MGKAIVLQNYKKLYIYITFYKNKNYELDVKPLYYRNIVNA